MNSKTNYEEYKQLLTSVLKEQSEELVFKKQLKNNNVYSDAIQNRFHNQISQRQSFRSLIPPNSRELNF
jgi:hypothetical protein